MVEGSGVAVVAGPAVNEAENTSPVLTLGIPGIVIVITSPTRLEVKLGNVLDIWLKVVKAGSVNCSVTFALSPGDSTVSVNVNPVAVKLATSKLTPSSKPNSLPPTIVTVAESCAVAEFWNPATGTNPLAGS